MPRRRIPDPLTIIYCVRCHKPTNGRGWYGAECQCFRPDTPAIGHTITGPLRG